MKKLDSILENEKLKVINYIYQCIKEAVHDYDTGDVTFSAFFAKLKLYREILDKLQD